MSLYNLKTKKKVKKLIEMKLKTNQPEKEEVVWKATELAS
jgi:hypothetical protein